VLYGILKQCFRFSYRACFAICVGILLPPTGAAADMTRLDTGDLIVRVSGMESKRGAIQYALYDSPENFPTREGRIAKGEVPVTSGGTIVIKGLAPGYYAVAVYHDENLNGEFDQGVFGIPLETYGFSNDARGFFSAPDFDDAKFQVRGQKTEISIELGR
jgi:uncharacterized protein (DUF2141 family)